MPGFRELPICLSLALALLLIGVANVHAQAITEEQLADRAAVMIERLGLTDEQIEQIKPLMQARNQKFVEIRENYAGDDSRSAKRKQFKESRDAQKAYEKAVEPLLTDAQVEEWKAMKKEARENLMERRKENR